MLGSGAQPDPQDTLPTTASDASWATKAAEVRALHAVSPRVRLSPTLGPRGGSSGKGCGGDVVSGAYAQTGREPHPGVHLYSQSALMGKRAAEGGRPYLGAGGPRAPIPPRHTGKARGSRDDRAVHPKAAWLSGHAGDAGGPWGAGKASWALDREKQGTGMQAALAEGRPQPDQAPAIPMGSACARTWRGSSHRAEGHSLGGSPGHRRSRTPPCQ